MVRCRRFDDGRRPRFEINGREIVAGQRDPPDIAVGRGADAVSAAALRRVPDLHLAGLRIEPAIDAVLAGEPDAPFSVERGGIEIGIGLALGRQRPDLHLFGLGIEADDGVLPAIGEPRRAVRSNDDAMRRRFGPERIAFNFAGRGIEQATNAGLLPGKPDFAGRPDRDVVRIIALGEVVDLDVLCRETAGDPGAGKNDRRGETINPCSTHDDLRRQRHNRNSLAALFRRRSRIGIANGCELPCARGCRRCHHAVARRVVSNAMFLHRIWRCRHKSGGTRSQSRQIAGVKVAGSLGPGWKPG